MTEQVMDVIEDDMVEDLADTAEDVDIADDVADVPEEPAGQVPVETPDAMAQYQADLADVRATIRQMREDEASAANEIIKLRAQLAATKTEAPPTMRTLYDAEGNPEQVPVVPEAQDTVAPQQTEFDSVMEVWNQTNAAKGPIAESLLESMRLSPKYSDIDSVVTPHSVAELYDKLAGAHSKRSGENYQQSLLRVKTAVMQQANPYGYVYGVLKNTAVTATAKTAATKPVPAAPATIADKGTAGGDAAGWTAAKIDSMEENELHTVPKAIFDSWLSGALK